MPEPYYQDDRVALHHGDCLDVLAQLPDASVDAVVTDPPYGLEFMGKDWDAFAPRDRKNATVWDGRRQAQNGWTEDAAERSGKGGGGPSYRSQHKGAKRCTLCGRRAFSGTPCTCPEPQWVLEHRQEAPSAMLGFQQWCTEWAWEAYRVLKPGGHLLAFGGTRTWHRLACAVEDSGFEVRDNIAWLYASGFPKSLNLLDERGQRTGWGTTLKPAFEPIVVARKPLAGTVAANVEQYGTGALNIDACRVGDRGEQSYTVTRWKPGATLNREGGTWKREEDDAPTVSGTLPAGRWPANVLLDGDQADELDRQSGERPAGGKVTGNQTARTGDSGIYGAYGAVENQPYGDTGGASRFFPTFRYEAKAPSGERPRVDGTVHPTVKPLDLMRWLVRLVTPPGGTVLEPFAGSGTTVEAALIEGFHCVAIEREADYLPLIMQRVHRRRDPIAAVRQVGGDLGLFDLDEETA